jgi:hypothetical protein
MAKAIEKRFASMQKTNARKALVEKLENQNTLSQVVSVLAGTVSAGLTGMVDGKYSSAPGDMATFGASPIPIAPTFGAGFVALGVVAHIMDAPTIGAALTSFGMKPVDIALYQGVRNIFE